MDHTKDQAGVDREVGIRKHRLIELGAWRSGPRSSGKLSNPGKIFFLKLAAESVRAVNLMKDKNGVSYARKAMIRCGLGLDLNGKWKESQLFPEMQMIINNHRAHFDGTTVPEEAERVAEIVQDSS